MINIHEKLFDTLPELGSDAFSVLLQIARFTSTGNQTKYLRNFKLSSLTGLTESKITKATKKLVELGYIEKKQLFVTEENQKYFTGKKIGSFAGLAYVIKTQYLSKYVNLSEEKVVVSNNMSELDNPSDGHNDDSVIDDSVIDDSVKLCLKSIDKNKVLKIKSIDNFKTRKFTNLKNIELETTSALEENLKKLEEYKVELGEMNEEQLQEEFLEIKLFKDMSWDQVIAKKQIDTIFKDIEDWMRNNIKLLKKSTRIKARVLSWARIGRYNIGWQRGSENKGRWDNKPQVKQYRSYWEKLEKKEPGKISKALGTYNPYN